jgi:hypothetical protein
MGWEPPIHKNGLWAKLNRVLLAKIVGSVSPGERIFIVVDDDFWEEVSKELRIQAHEIKEFVVDMLRDDWRIAFRVDAELQDPMVFPLIAVQLYAAFRMRKEGAYGQNAYNPRLLEIFGKQGEVVWLQEQYRLYQERTWKTAQEILEHLDYQFPIPSSKHGAGRYTQYPRLHTLLNQQDLPISCGHTSDTPILNVGIRRGLFFEYPSKSA